MVAEARMYVDSPEAWMTAVLRGEAAAFPADAGASFHQAFHEASAYHGVRPLLSDALKDAAGEVWSASLRESLAFETRTQAVRELIRKQEVRRVLSALRASGIEPLLLKGTPLAYSLYAAPVQRPRGDTDLLICPEDKDAADSVLSQLGYAKPHAVGGKFVSTQASYSRTDTFGITHILDVHWRLSNNQLFARALSYGEAAREAVPVPSLGPHARTLGPVHALLLACMHRVGHKTSPYYVGDKAYLGGDRLIWLFDIHLLMTRMTADERRRFVELAVGKKMRGIALDGLQRARAVFSTVIPSDVLDALASGPPERSARLLDGSHLQKWVSNFEAVGGWMDRFALAREHLFPAPAYMLAKYRTRVRLYLPLLYLHRAVRGIWKILRAD